MAQHPTIASEFSQKAQSVLFQGDCLDLLKQIPNGTIQLIVTSPPYNVGKCYEKKGDFDAYVAWQTTIIQECHRVLSNEGSICWQVGNYVDNSSIIPLDIALYPAFANLGMKMRNRIIWHFEHGLHCSKRFSGRHETIMWFTKSENYTFNVDPVRVPQKYPGKKYFKGPKIGQYSCNPLGKNPGDVWIIPNVKNNHVEKTIHPCQFPIELVERLILSMTNPDDWVLDPFSGVGTSVAAAILNKRRGMGAEMLPEYVAIAEKRVQEAFEGVLPVRSMDQPIYDPKNAGANLTTAPWLPQTTIRKQKTNTEKPEQLRLLETPEILLTKHIPT
jgi:adenine-specific DNA-methyltransferase